MTVFSAWWPVFTNIIIPLMAGLTFFALARYVVHIAPMRTLVTGEKTYKGAAWGFAFFGAYLISRPLQVLLGPRPIPLVINEVREFCMMALFAPAVFVAMMSLCFGSDRIPRSAVAALFGLGGVLGLAFIVVNAFAIGGSEVIFMIGDYPAHDGLWFKNPSAEAPALMRILFTIRMLDPVLLLILAGGVVLRHAITYPGEKRLVYDNMPKKLFFLAAAVFAFPLSMMLAGILYFWFGLPNQWWIYYLGALVAGLLEAVSLSLPLRKEVQISEHA